MILDQSDRFSLRIMLGYQVVHTTSLICSGTTSPNLNYALAS